MNSLLNLSEQCVPAARKANSSLGFVNKAGRLREEMVPPLALLRPHLDTASSFESLVCARRP